jgi:hypothetical protein
MRQRGRPSAESLMVVPTVSIQRPDPPAELSIEQAEVWRAYVGDMPADWFTPKTHPDLIGLCRLVNQFPAVGAGVAGVRGGDTEGSGGVRSVPPNSENA